MKTRNNLNIKQESILETLDLIEETPVNVKTKGGELTVSFEEFNGGYRNIWLSGEASMVFAGEFAC